MNKKLLAFLTLILVFIGSSFQNCSPVRFSEGDKTPAPQDAPDNSLQGNGDSYSGKLYVARSKGECGVAGDVRAAIHNDGFAFKLLMWECQRVGPETIPLTELTLDEQDSSFIIYKGIVFNENGNELELPDQTKDEEPEPIDFAQIFAAIGTCPEGQALAGIDSEGKGICRDLPAPQSQGGGGGGSPCSGPKPRCECVFGGTAQIICTSTGWVCDQNCDSN